MKTSDRMGICEQCGAQQFLSYVICNYNGVCRGKVIPLIEKPKKQ